jgi:hypothetical protein
MQATDKVPAPHFAEHLNKDTFKMSAGKTQRSNAIHENSETQTVPF